MVADVIVVIPYTDLAPPSFALRCETELDKRGAYELQGSRIRKRGKCQHQISM